LSRGGFSTASVRGDIPRASDLCRHNRESLDEGGSRGGKSLRRLLAGVAPLALVFVIFAGPARADDPLAGGASPVISGAATTPVRTAATAAAETKATEVVPQQTATEAAQPIIAVAQRTSDTATAAAAETVTEVNRGTAGTSGQASAEAVTKATETLTRVTGVVEGTAGEGDRLCRPGRSRGGSTGT